MSEDPAPEPAEAVDPAVLRIGALLAPVLSRCKVDPVLRQEMTVFEAAAFTLDGEGAVCRAGPRICTVFPGQVVIGHALWPQVKKIPL